MRILASSDLHYNIPRSKEPAEDLARRVVRRGGDVFILAGDTAAIDPEMFLRGLELFHDFRGRKFLVAGNHDLWVVPGDCSFEKWTQRLPAAAREAGFEMLDHAPAVVGGIGFVGNIGWYDYSFRDDTLAIPMRFYEAKVAPGRAWRLEEYRHLLAPISDLRPDHLEITTAWRDGEYVKFPMPDAGFVEHLIERLEGDLAAVAGQCQTIVTVLHHVPRRELVWYRGDPNWDFAAAFLGSGRFRETLDRYPAIRLCLSGHNHRENALKEGNVDYISIGSTYTEKILLEFDL